MFSGNLKLKFSFSPENSTLQQTKRYTFQTVSVFQLQVTYNFVTVVGIYLLIFYSFCSKSFKTINNELVFVTTILPHKHMNLIKKSQIPNYPIFCWLSLLHIPTLPLHYYITIIIVLLFDCMLISLLIVIVIVNIVSMLLLHNSRVLL